MKKEESKVEVRHIPLVHNGAVIDMAVLPAARTPPREWIRVRPTLFGYLFEDFVLRPFSLEAFRLFEARMRSSDDTAREVVVQMYLREDELENFPRYASLMTRIANREPIFAMLVA